MKLLQKLLLINWHYIERELIEFSGINFLTGKNASGKSTIIDALQLLVLGDTSGGFFNKAANDNSQRTLRGYLRGEVADDGETGFIYLRDGVFSSYIVAEFFDTIRKKTFCFGVVFDVYRDDNPQHKFFLLEQPLPEHQFIIDDIPMDYQTLRNHLKSTGKAKHQFFDTNRSYRSTFRGKMGGLNEKFFSLFKKAVPFSPIMDIEKFICEFVCDVSSRIEISDMQDNIRHYKQLEQDVGFVKERIERLTDISSKFQDFDTEQRRLQEQHYLMDRAQLQDSDDRITELQKRIRQNKEAITRLADQVKQKEKEIHQLEEKKEHLLQEKFQSDLYKKMESLQKQLEDLAAQQEQLDGVRHELAQMMAMTGTAWTKALNCYAERIALPEKAEISGRSKKVELVELAKSTELAEKVTERAVLSESVEKARRFTSLKAETRYLSGIKPDMLIRPQIIEELRTERLQGIRSQMKDFQSEIQELYFAGKSQLDAARKQAAELDTEIANLKKGIKPYEAKLLELRQEIKDQLQEQYGLEAIHKADHQAEALSMKEQQGQEAAHRANLAGALSQKEQPDQDVPVEIFCELIEIRDKKWQDSIEGYLHTQKFYLLVPPEFFVSALKIYDQLKFERQFYDIGLVDIGKLQELNPRLMPGSLAEEVVTDNPYARVFADYLLGRVMKCEQVEDLRCHRTAITPTGMLYHSFTARQINPQRWRIPYIGKQALEKQIEIKGKELDVLTQKIISMESRFKVLEGLKEVEPIAEDSIAHISGSLQQLKTYTDLVQERQQVKDAMEKLDLSYLDKLDQAIGQVEKQKEAADQQCNELKKENNKLEYQNSNIADEKIPDEESRRAALRQKIEENYAAEWVQETGEPRFLKELKKKGSPSKILDSFYSQLERTRSQADKKWQVLVSVRSDYNRDYKMSYDINFPENIHFDEELNDLRGTHLADYEAKIKDAGEKAQKQFQEDFISKLKHNIDTVKGQIEELNDALKNVAFGRESYRFEIKPNPNYKNFYDMITDSMLLEGFNLFSQTFQAKHRDAIDELFKQIVDVGEGNLTADQRSELERNIEKFTDYRTYLNFDLISKDESGRESRLSRTIAKKSGGETQTPFYISVLASFVRVYRLQQRSRRGESKTLSLIVFDEAFNKMDHQRIQESIKLLRTFGLQAVICAPTEKIGDIAPLVDRTLCVTRLKNVTVVRAFDPKTLEDEHELPGQYHQPAAR